MISSVIIAYNESHNLRRCLNSIKDFVDEIVVVDLGSTDKSDELYQEFKVRVYKHAWVSYADPIRNWAIEKAKGEWILVLDPDEELSVSLINRLTTFIKSEESKEYVAVNIPFKNIFFGTWIAHTNFWPDKHLRFFKRGSLKWQTRVHSYPLVDGKILELPEEEKFAIVHHSYTSWKQFATKQKKYALIEAKNRRENGESFSLFRLIWLPIREFLARFIKHQGYLDGINGLFLTAILMWYHLLVEYYLIVSPKKYLK